MADDTFLIAAHVSRREKLIAARRRRHRRYVFTAALLLVMGGSAGAFALTRGRDTTTKHAASNLAAPPVYTGKANALPQVKVLKKQAPPRVLIHDAPLRLWIGGDSLAGSLGPALGKIVGATGVVHTQVDYRVSSGISNDGVRDWSQRANDQMAQYDPEAVVFEIGTNDASIVNSQLNADGVPAWEPLYRTQVARMMDTLRGPPGHRRTVLWVGAPPMSLGWRDRGVRELDRVMREEAKKRAPEVVYVDAYTLFADKDGNYTSTLRTLSGNVEQVRISDGVHFSDAGANYLGAVLYGLLDARWEIAKHADPAQPINWAESSGSSGVSSGYSGYSGSGSSRRNNGSSGSNGRQTPGTPAPPPSLETTAPPVSSPAPTAPPATTPQSTTGSTTPKPSTATTVKPSSGTTPAP